MDTKKLQSMITEFNSKRQGWRELHTPENLVKSIAIESSELLELAQWEVNEDECRWEDEIADVAIYLFELCNVMKIDIANCVLKKLEVNEKRFPASVHNI